MQKQHQILKQKFKLSPQQIQFLGLLAIPLVDLEKRIEEEIEENPTLEESDATDSIDNKEENFHYKNKDSKQDFIVNNLTGNKICIKINDIVMSIDKNYYRPTEVDLLIGNPSKAQNKLNWKPKYNLDTLIDEMIKSDLNIIKNEK